MVYPAGRCSSRPLGRGQECCQTSEIAWNRPPTPRELSGPRFQKSAEAEKACLMPILCALQPRPSFPLPGSAGEASWSCLEPCVRSSARGSAAPAPTPLPPHPPQDETRRDKGGPWRRQLSFREEGPRASVVGAPAVTLWRSPSTRQPPRARSLTACTWQGHGLPI